MRALAKSAAAVASLQRKQAALDRRAAGWVPADKRAKGPKLKTGPKPGTLLKPMTMRKCVACGTEFRVYPSTKQRFCSYKCHINSGGAIRAGLASREASVRYGAKKDANHKVMVEEMTKLGLAIIDLSGLGRGIPDLIVFVPKISEVHLVEIKNTKTSYGRRGMNSNQKAWATGWKGAPVIVLRSVEEACHLANGRLDLLERFHA